MKRREFLATVAAGSLLFPGLQDVLKAASKGKTVYGGWLGGVNRRSILTKINGSELFSRRGTKLKGTGKGKRVFLWKAMEKATGRNLVPHSQTVGDCVAQAWALGVDILTAVQINLHKKNEQWVAKCATEPIYAGGRVEIGGGVIGDGDGMHGQWAAKWCKQYGILLRQKYGPFDFTTYSGQKARNWAHKCDSCTSWGGGVPDELEPICKKHPVKTATVVRTWSEARDAIANGYPIPICSNYGFSLRRNENGFADKSGKWMHCMLLAGIDDTGSRPGGLIINSWGNDWISGPKRHGQPEGSFWADANVIEGMLKQNDSFAISNYIGYPRQELNYDIF